MMNWDFLQTGEYAKARQMFQEMDQMRMAWAQLQPVGLRRSEIGTLGAVAHLTGCKTGPVTISALAQEMHLSVPGVSQKVSELEKQGYLRRVAAKHDRRVVTVQLTGKGQKAAENSLRDFLRRIESTLARLGNEDVDTLFFLMHKLRLALEEEGKNMQGGTPS